MLKARDYPEVSRACGQLQHVGRDGWTGNRLEIESRTDRHRRCCLCKCQMEIAEAGEHHSPSSPNLCRINRDYGLSRDTRLSQRGQQMQEPRRDHKWDCTPKQMSRDVEFVRDAGLMLPSGMIGRPSCGFRPIGPNRGHGVSTVGRQFANLCYRFASFRV
jgi:hypothetical protein